MTPEELAAEILYKSYVFNRERFPEIKPERYVTLYEHAAEYERRYQDSINAYANGMIRRDQEQPTWLRNINTGGRDIKNGY